MISYDLINVTVTDFQKLDRGTDTIDPRFPVRPEQPELRIAKLKSMKLNLTTFPVVAYQTNAPIVFMLLGKFFESSI